MKYHYEDEDTKISVYLKPKGNIMAQANVSLKIASQNFITIKGFVIWKSTWIDPRFQEQVNITPPRRYIKGTWLDLVFFENIVDWSQMEEKIYSAYFKAKSEEDKKLIKNEDVDPDGIPF